MSVDVFERYELKYMLNRAQRAALEHIIGEHMDHDAFGGHTVMSMYYDTPERVLIGRSMEKPVYKEKLRVRSYGVPEADGKVYVELKKKYRGVVYKRRCPMTLRQAEAFLENEGEPTCQIEREIRALTSRYPNIGPSMLLCYEREAYFGRGGEAQARITFDTAIRYRTDELSLARGCRGRELINKGDSLMEIKLPGYMPLWLARALDALEIYPCSFSKYGAAYSRLMREGQFETTQNTKEMMGCA